MSTRFNNRGNKELRPIKFTKDYTKHAMSSILVEFGDTKVMLRLLLMKKRQNGWKKMIQEVG